jgi:hypothetical protein
VTIGNGIRGDGHDGGDGWWFAKHQSEFRHACGFVGRQRWQQGVLKRSGASRALRDLGRERARGGGHETFVRYAALAAKHAPALRAVYGGKGACRWSFRTKMLYSREMHRICQCLALGSHQVKGLKWQKPSCGAARMVRTPSGVRPRIAVVCMGDASAGWGSVISRRLSAPVIKLRGFFRRHYCSEDGVARGVRISNASMARIRMHLTTVGEYRSSQTCSRCFDPRGLKPYRKGQRAVFKLKACPHGDQPVAPDRLAAQRHDRAPHLVVDRDRNAARNIAVLGLAHLVPADMLHQSQLQQLLHCMHRSARRAWLGLEPQLGQQDQ